jgi:type II secretory pathway pseudopilin PulG
MVVEQKEKEETGFSVVELVVALAILALIATSVLGLYAVMVQTTFIAKRRAVASNLATNQMEYLKSLSYNNLAVVGGSIVATNPLPASFNTTVNGNVYVVKTSINYVDDAYDGCRILSQCVNTPVPSGAPSNDLNPADYKSINVAVYTTANLKLAEVDTKVSARVAETDSNTGALLVRVIDPTGNPISGATVNVTNTTTSPNVNVNDSTDAGGVAIFYNLPPDTTNFDYKITASFTGFSTLNTIVAVSGLTPTYPNQQIVTQQSSSVTLTLKPQGQYSLAGEVVNTAGAPIANMRVNMKGGYKKYTSTTNTEYYYDTLSPTDIRPTTDAGGLFAFTNLVPGNYYFCGDAGATSCTAGGTTYYLAAAVPYGGTDTLHPIVVPTYLASSPPATTFLQDGNNYLQKVRLIMSTSSSYPRVRTITPAQESLSGGTLNAFAFTITGNNLPCSSSAASCSTTVRFLQASNTYTASCTGTSGGTTLNCTADLTGIAAGNTQLVIIVGSNTLTLPASPLIGGVVIIT